MTENESQPEEHQYTVEELRLMSVNGVNILYKAFKDLEKKLKEERMKTKVLTDTLKELTEAR